MQAEYNPELIKSGQRGRYYQQYQESTNLVLLDPDVATVFPDEKAVNDALRALINAAKASVPSSEGR